MLPSDLIIEVRDLDLQRTHQVLPQYWTDVIVTMMLRRVGDWKLSLPAELPAAQALAQPGAGIIITGPDGVLMSGPVETFEKKQTTRDSFGRLFFEGVDDNCLLGDPLAWPDPAHAAGGQEADYDVRTGPAETVIRNYINANVGPGALSARRKALAQKLILSVDGARGGTVRGSARFDILGELVEPLGKLGGVCYRIVQDVDGEGDPALVLEFWEPADKSKLIRLDIANGLLTAADFKTSAPTVTRALPLGQGSGAERTVLEVTNADAEAAEATWGRRIERAKDRRDTDDPDDLQQAGEELLLDGGKTATTSKLTPTDDLTMQFMRDWNVGDVISVVIGDDEVPEIVTSAVIGISSKGVKIGARIGEA